MSEILYDPTGEREPRTRQALAKPSALEGLTLGLLDISKARGDVFLNQLDALFRARGVAVKRYKKPTFTRPAPASLLQDIARECDVVVEALAD